MINPLEYIFIFIGMLALISALAITVNFLKNKNIYKINFIMFVHIFKKIKKISFYYGCIILI